MVTNKKPRGRKLDASSKSGQIRELLKTGMTPSDIAKKVGCKPALVYNVKAKANEGGGGAKPKAGRPAKAAAPSISRGMDGIGAILDAVKKGENERKQMRAALERIQSVIRDALA